VTWDWDFGDGNTSTAQNPSHTYAAGATYTVLLTVTDDGSATDTISQDVRVSDGSGGFTLTAIGYKVRGHQRADLEWSGATSTDVVIYRDGAMITTSANDGFYTDNIDNRGGGSYTYQVCEAGNPTCSNEATVTF
jgi:PKD repeat protein